jgi:hypothetical protein
VKGGGRQEVIGDKEMAITINGAPAGRPENREPGSRLPMKNAELAPTEPGEMCRPATTDTRRAVAGTMLAKVRDSH